MAIFNLKPDELKTIREALENLKGQELAGLTEVFIPYQIAAKLDRIDAALAALARQPVQWMPVPRSLEYDLITHAIRTGEIPEKYRICCLSPVSEPVAQSS